MDTRKSRRNRGKKYEVKKVEEKQKEDIEQKDKYKIREDE